MSNIYEIYMDLRKNHPWLQKSEEGLLGKQTTTQPGQATERIGGVFGHGGLSDKALEKAGGAAGDYFLGQKKAVSPPSTYGTHAEQVARPGFKGSPFDKHIDIAQEKVHQTLSTVVHKGVETGEDILKWAFPNASFTKNSGVSKGEKETLNEMIKSGKIDPGFVRHLKNKTGPATQQDISGLEKFIGVSKEDAMKNWKDKNGFEGLMANPAFTLGLALMQSSAQGKSIGEDVMNNFIKAAGISEHYKDRIEARTQVLGPPTKAERDLADSALASIGISGPGWGTKTWDFIKIWGKDNTADYNAGLNKIVVKAKQIINKKYEGKTHQVTRQDYIDAFKELQRTGEIGSVENIFGVGIKDMKKGHTRKKGLIEQKVNQIFGPDNIFLRRAEGGPIPAGQPAIVGEKGPEIIVPKTDVNVVSNDDAQVMSMLLASNPQLQNVSKARAESILRSRFPDYFA